ncbi:MAG: DNA-processing protein DprA [Thermodesulfobacteriota bacterium]
MENLIYILALRTVNGIGNKLAERLLLKFDSAKDIFSLSEDELIECEGVTRKLASSIRSFSDWGSVEKAIKKSEKLGFKIYSLLDKNYPVNLLNLYEKPTVIYVLGDVKKEDENSVAIVGSRICSSYGKKVAQNLSRQLAERGITIISGMARGIDSISHKAAVDFGGRTIAVMGSGLDRIYPPENMRLYKLISENGAVISEFSLGTPPDAQNFPQRNRLISGLSKGVIIVQASKQSGSLITANFALEQNKEVFAVPGNIDSRLSEGTNLLIKKGAKLIENADDVIDELTLISDYKIKKKAGNVEVINNLNSEEKIVLESIGSIQLYIDEIIDKTKIEHKKLFSILLDLELKGILEQLPGKIYQVKY